MSFAPRAIGWCLPLIGALALAPAAVIAQVAGDDGYRIQSFSIDGGTPATSVGDGYRLRGSVGQPDAGVLAANGYVLRGGFWSGAVATPNDIIFADGFEASSSALHPRGELP